MIEKITKYREAEGVSYSLLSKMSVSPANLLKEKEETDSMNFGSLVDCIMFTPEDFDSRFYVTNVKKPGGEMLKWLDAFLNFELPSDYSLNDYDNVILKTREISGYNKQLKAETALSKFHSECDDFLNEMAIAGERKVIVQDDFTRATSLQCKLINNEFTAPYFQESKFQEDIYFELDEVKCKGLLDGVIFKGKDIYPWDLKTTSESTLNFEREFIKWNYYIQAALYRSGLQKLYPKHKVHPFTFIVVNDWEEPMIWKVPEMLHSISMNSGQLRSGRKIKGVYELLEEYKWYEETKLYTYPKVFYDNEGCLNIDII